MPFSVRLVCLLFYAPCVHANTGQRRKTQNVAVAAEAFVEKCRLTVKSTASWTLSPNCIPYCTIANCTPPTNSTLQMACTPSGLAWVDPNMSYYTSTKDGCGALHRHNIRTIVFVGDSYVRHAYEGTALLLSGDFERGALGKTVSTQCNGDAQFEEKNCRLFISQSIQVCSSKVTLSYSASSNRPYVSDSTDIVVWGLGNHPINGDYVKRHGVYDADVVAAEVFAPMCDGPKHQHNLTFTAHISNNAHPRLLWLLPHSRLSDLPGDQSREAIQSFDEHSCMYVRDMCGVSSIDVYSPTNALVKYHSDEARKMTWDGVHWSRTVNILKAQIILNLIAVISQSR